MKKFTFSLAVLFTLATSHAQFSENFNSATITSLTNSCWVVNGVSTTNQPGEAISGTSIYTQPPVNPGSKIDLYTPVLTLLSTTSTIEFDYRLSQVLGGNATRTIVIGIVNTFGVVVTSNSIVIAAGNSTAVQHYTRMFNTPLLGANRIFLRVMGDGGNGNVRLVLDNFQISNATVPGTFGGCILAPIIESTLPVKLASFTATLNNNKTDLKWTTATEINVSHFVVERSTDGINYSDAGIVFAVGNSTDKVNYSFSDNLVSVTSPVVYYRLRSVDIDEKAEYSETRVIRLSKSKHEEISILAFPNPATTELRVTVPASWQNKRVSYEVIGASGQVVRRIQIASSSQTENINISTIAPGFYLVKAICGTEMAQQRIVKQ